MNLKDMKLGDTHTEEFGSALVTLTREAGWYRIRVLIATGVFTPVVIPEPSVILDADLLQERGLRMGVLSGAAWMAEKLGREDLAGDIRAALDWTRGLSDDLNGLAGMTDAERNRLAQ